MKAYFLFCFFILACSFMFPSVERAKKNEAVFQISFHQKVQVYIVDIDTYVCVRGADADLVNKAEEDSAMFPFSLPYGSRSDNRCCAHKTNQKVMLSGELLAQVLHKKQEMKLAKKNK